MSLSQDSSLAPSQFPSSLSRAKSEQILQDNNLESPTPSLRLDPCHHTQLLLNILPKINKNSSPPSHDFFRTLKDTYSDYPLVMKALNCSEHYPWPPPNLPGTLHDGEAFENKTTLWLQHLYQGIGSKPLEEVEELARAIDKRIKLDFGSKSGSEDYYGLSMERNSPYSIYSTKVNLQLETDLKDQVWFEGRIHENIHSTRQLFKMLKSINKHIQAKSSIKKGQKVKINTQIFMFLVTVAQSYCLSHSQPRHSPHSTQWQAQTAVHLDSYDLRISLEHDSSSKPYLYLLLRLQQSEVHRIKPSQFASRLHKINNHLEQHNYSKSHIHASRMVYSVDESARRGKGAFGEVVAGQGLHLESVQHVSMQEQVWYYKRRKVAVKRLKESEGEYNKRQHRIPLKRQHLILELIREVKYHQAIKKASGQLTNSAVSQLRGIDSLVMLLQSYKMPKERTSHNEYTQEHCLVFEEYQCHLGHPTVMESIKENGDKQDEGASWTDIARMIFEGLNCLHTGIGQAYPHTLDKYFNKQGQSDKEPTINTKVPPKRLGIYHRDLKPKNIMLTLSPDRSPSLAIIDFAMARIVDLDHPPPGISCGTPYYKAPEVHQHHFYTPKVDVWSAGVLLYDLTSPNRPLLERSDTENFRVIVKGVEERLEKEEEEANGWMKEWLSLLRMCVVVDQHERRSSGQVLESLQQYSGVVAEIKVEPKKDDQSNQIKKKNHPESPALYSLRPWISPNEIHSSTYLAQSIIASLYNVSHPLPSLTRRCSLELAGILEIYLSIVADLTDSQQLSPEDKQQKEKTVNILISLCQYLHPCFQLNQPALSSQMQLLLPHLHYILDTLIK